MPKATEKRPRKKDMTAWQDLDTEIGARVISVLEKGGYIAFWHNYSQGLTIRLMYENQQETFAYEDEAEYRSATGEIDDWLARLPNDKPAKTEKQHPHDKVKGR